MSEGRKARLQSFVDWAREHISGDEKGEAQIFLDRLFQAFGQKGLLEVGGKAEFRIKKAQEDGGGTSFADYVWKPNVLIEMKKRGVDLATTYQQAFKYWERLVPGRPNYVVLCNFDELWVYDFDIQLDEPVDRVTLEELPGRYGPLAFLFPTLETPVFGNNQEQVTRDAANRLATLFNKLIARRVERPRAQRFVLQSLIALFSEDIGLLDPYTFTRILAECDMPEKAYDLIGGLFAEMNTPGRTPGGRFKGVDYFNSGIFSDPIRLELYSDELSQLRKAAEGDWSMVRPEIFGTLFEHSVEHEERHAFGAHFTSGVDIMKIVRPTIIDPWEQLITSAKKIEELRSLHLRMQHYKVLDPACGSGNFLYIAYRELKRLERRLFERMDQLSTRKDKSQRRLSFVTARQFYGMDINPFAVELAKVTMMIARKLAIDELHMEEPALPLDNLDGNFLTGDALITFPDTGEPFRPAWPEADVIIGNPPFLGAKRLKPERGPDYVNAVRKLYPEVPGMADYCVYWFRRAHDHLPECIPDKPESGRAGLVGTQNIRNNKSREGGMDHIVASGTVVEAVDNQPWSGEANVHVSIANWVKHPAPALGSAGQLSPRKRSALLIPAKRKLWFKAEPPPGLKRKRKRGQGSAAKIYELDFREGATINSALSIHTDVGPAKVLECNKSPQRCFNGQMLGHKSFLLTSRERSDIVAKHPESNAVILPYLNGREFLSGAGGPERFVLDFGQLDQLEAAHYKGAFNWVKNRVLPDRQRKATEGKDSTGKMRTHHKGFLDRWWQLSFGRPELITKINGLPRYLACSLVTKRSIFVFVDPRIRPSNLLQVFTYGDDYTFGIVQSGIQWRWFTQKCSKLKSDYRFGEAVWNTFPWPQSPKKTDIEAVAKAGREVRRVRDEALKKIKGGLRAVYRTLELPGKNPLKDAHAALDAAVLKAYGFNAKDDLLRQVLDLNLAVAERIERGEPVTAPGIPPDYPRPAELVTDDCIRPE